MIGRILQHDYVLANGKISAPFAMIDKGDGFGQTGAVRWTLGWAIGLCLILEERRVITR
jgi:hypothetical protein